MPSLYQQIERAANDAYDGLFGERFRHEPRVTPVNGRPSVDPDRPAYELDGILIEDPYQAEPRPGEHFRASTSVVLSVINDKLAHEVRAGDRFIRVDTGEVFEATGDIQPDRTSRTEIRLVKIK